MSNQQLLSKLRGKDYQESYQEPRIMNYDKNIGVLHEGGIDIWQLTAPVIQNHLWDQSQFAKFELLEDGEHMIVEFDNRKFFLIEVDTFTILREYRLPENALRHNQLQNGDLLVVLRNEEFDPSLAEAAKHTEDKGMRNRESLRDLKKMAMEEDEGVKNEENFESQLRAVLEKNKFVKKSLKNVSSFRSNAQMPSGIDLDTVRTDTNDKDNKKMPVPDAIKLDMEEIEEDEEIMNDYNINSINRDTALSKYNQNVQKSNNESLINLREKKSTLAKKANESKFVNIRINGEVVSQPVNKKIFKYRLVRILMEHYSLNDPEEKGIHTLFQTNSEIIKLFSTLTEIKKDDDIKGATDHFKRFQSRVKANSRFAGNRVNLVLVGLLNKNIYEINYETNKYSVPIQEQIISERIFRSSVIQAALENAQEQGGGKKPGNLPLPIKKANTLNLTNADQVTGFDTNTEHDKLKSTQEIGDIALKPKETRALDSIHLIKALKYVDNHRVVMAAALHQNLISKKFSLKIYGQYESMPYSEIRINFDKSIKTSLAEEFYIELMRIPKKTEKEPIYHFFVYSSMFVATFTFNLHLNSLEFNHFLKKETSSYLNVRFSMNRRLFYIPMNSQIHIYDETLSHFIYFLETKHNIDETLLLDSRDLLIVYDKKKYYELDLDEFKFQTVLSSSSKALQSFRLLINFPVLTPGARWNATFYTKNKHQIFSVPFQENLDLLNFPFEDLQKCFLKKNYKKFLEKYAEYYFEQIKETARKDFIYGSLNPLLFSIYHNDSNLLEDLLDNYFYPNKIINYVSPLEYSFAMNYRTTIKVLCDKLIRRDDFISFSRSDFKNLLKSNILTCHKLIATLPGEPIVNILPKLVYMTSNVQAILHDYLTSLLIYIKKEDLKYTAKEPQELKPEKKKKNPLIDREITSDVEDELQAQSDRDLDIEIEKTTRRYVQDQDSDRLFKSEVIIKSVPFKYNYHYGTEDSVTFIYNYSISENQEFILSDWKEIVTNKWNGLKVPYMLITLLYFSYVLFFLLSSVFYNDITALRGFSLLLNIILIIFELIQMITYFNYKPKM